MFVIFLATILGHFGSSSSAHASTTRSSAITIVEVHANPVVLPKPERAPLAALTLPSEPDPASAPTTAPARRATAATPTPATTTKKTAVPKPSAKISRTLPQEVPFFSQFADIASPKWQKVGCGIADLTMIVNYYQPGAVSVETLLKKGIAAGAYDYDAGWIYQGLINLSHEYGLDGTYHSLKGYRESVALSKFKDYLAGGPVILSVHYKFDPKSTIPHLIVVNNIKDDVVYYNDPATKGPGTISLNDFLKGWTRNVIVIRPDGAA